MKRFYTSVSLDQSPDRAGFRVLLDGRPIRTVGGQPQIVPTSALAEAMVSEWAEQGETIEATRFIFRDLADYAIDVVAKDPASLATSLLGYAETDTLCYRADPEDAFAQRQDAVWDPLLEQAEARYGRFTRISGIMHQPQPAETLAALREEVATLTPFALAALQTTTSLAASLVLGLGAIAPDAAIEDLWNAACLEEDWQAELWGRDAEAEERRARRGAAFAAAHRFAVLAAGA